MIDLDFDEEDAALAVSLRRFCADCCSDAAVSAASAPGAVWPNELWRGLADLGVLALATPEGGGGATSVVAAMEELGAANAPGPLVATFAATQLLGGIDRAAVVTGDSIVSLGEQPLMPWLPVAGVIIELDEGRAYLATPVDDVEGVETLGGEPWGRCRLERIADLGDAAVALQLANAAMAAYLAGAGHRLLDLASSYANDRVQFRTSIGTFQAVAHPLAESAMRLSAARSLARLAADGIDRRDAGASALAATARLSATKASLGIAYQAHQTFGAMGFTVEGPVAAVSARIRQVSMLIPQPVTMRDAVLGAHGF